jgi:uncharacterized damage-inducible protein DinB
MTDNFQSLFAYHRWAENRVIESCRLLAPGQYAEPETFEVGWKSIRAVIVHLAWANQIWARRLLREPAIPMFTADDLPTIDDAADCLNSGHDRLSNEVLPAFDAQALAAPFHYTNFQGRAVVAPLWSLLLHVVTHGTYHRGQIASKLKRRGVDPPVTDFVYWAIENTPQNPPHPG